MRVLLTATITALCVLLLSALAPSTTRAEEMGLVLESHVGDRPRDADYLLGPLLDEFKKGGYQSSSVAGTRIHSKHSISSKELSPQQLAEARQLVLDARNAFVDIRFEGAVDSANRAVALLLSRPATMARQQDVRDYLYDALIVASMAHARLGNKVELEATMMEYMRSFPKREVSNSKFGPEAKGLYQRINRRMRTLKKGELQIAAAPGATIYVNETHQGIGSLKVKLYPGRYRIYTQNGAQPGRVHIAEVEAGREHTLVVDPVIDTALRTSGNMVGFVFPEERLRAEHEKRVALELGRALGAKNIVLVGMHKIQGKESIVATALSVRESEIGASARVPLPSGGAPSASQLRALAAFVAGEKPPTADIQVLGPNTVSGVHQGSGPVDVSLKSASSDTGLSPAWRYGSWAIGAGAIGVGAYLVAIHDTGTCGESVCPENYNTLAPGIGAIVGGAAMGALGFYLWGKEDGPKRTVALTPTTGGFQAVISGSF